MFNQVKFAPQQGWQCPVCGNILSPYTTMCPCKGIGSNTLSTTDSEEINIDLTRHEMKTDNMNTYFKQFSKN